MQGTVKGYNAGAMILHWAIALAILFQLAIGFAMSRLDVFPDPLRFSLFQWHKTVGLLVLSLTLSRIAWRIFNPPPAQGEMARAEKALAGLVHVLFYALMLLVPLSGWLVVSTSPTRIATLLFLSEHLPWPHLPVPSTGGALQGGAETAHVWLAYSIAGLLVLHVAGALKHSIVDRAPSFSRMLPIGRLPRQSTALIAIPIAAAAAAVFIGGGLAVGQRGGDAAAAGAAVIAAPAASPAASTGWTIDKAASRLGYSVTFSGKTVGGSVGNWDAAVRFDPDALASASASVVVDTASVAIDDPFIRSNLGGPDGLDATAQPQAKVELTTFSTTPDGFVGKGTMTIKGTTAPIEVPFTFAETADGTAEVKGSATFDRMTYKLGAQNDASGQWLALPIAISFELRATKR